MATIPAAGAEADAAYRPDAFRDHVAPLVARFCTDCHGTDEPEAGLTLADRSAAMRTPVEIAVWRQVLERIEGVQMPPIEAPQPAPAARAAAVAWIKGALRARGERVDDLKALAAARGNLVDHGALFDESVAGAGSTTERVWRVSQRTYDEFFRELDERLQLGIVKSAESLKCPWGTPPSWDFGDYSSAHRLSEAEMGQHVNNCTRVARAVRGKQALPALDAAVAAGTAVTPAAAEAAVAETFEKLLRFRPSADELARHVGFLQRQLAKGEPGDGAELFVVAVLCHPEMLYRVERPNAGGRAMPAPRQLARSIALTLTDREPDAALLEAAEAGRLGTPADVRREVQRMLADRDMPKPRILQFFRDYFGYTGAGSTFKCVDEVARTHLVNLPDCGQGNQALVRDTDALVTWAVDADRQVLRTLLTTPKIFLFVNYTAGMREERQRKEAERKRDAEKAAREGKPFDPNAEKYRVSFGFLSDANAGRALRLIYGVMPPEEWFATYGTKVNDRRGQFPAPSLLRLTAADFSDTMPHDSPPGQRMGMLTQPAWLQTQSATSENHPIHRGRWIREKLLGGFIPAVPITVDAKLPDEPHHGLRERMRVTRDAYCWQCHRLMDPLGLPFEQFDHLGMFRTAELVTRPKDAGSKGSDWQTIPLDTSGHLEGSGDPNLDGPVADPFELITKLAASRKVEQVFVRHVFRYFLGRNETLADGAALRAAHAAYVDSDGSLKKLLESLLASDPFLYREAAAAADGDGQGTRPASGP